MAKTTVRDKVWKDTLARTVKAGNAVKPADIAEKTGASESMTRQCLLNIYDAGFIDRRTDPDGNVKYIPASEVSWEE